MTDKTELLIEANKRGLLKGRKKAAFDAAVKRGIISLPEQSSSVLGDITIPREVPVDTQEIPSFGELIVGGGELALTVGTSGVAVPLFGALALGDLIASEITGDDTGIDKAEARLELMENFIFTPKTRGGKQVASVVSKPFKAVDEFTTELGSVVAEKTGSPATGAITKATTEVLPEALLGTRVRAPKESAQVRDLENKANELNIDLEARSGELGDDIRDAAVDITGGNESKGFSLPEIAKQVQDIKTSVKSEVDSLYTKARTQGEAFVDGELLKPIPGLIEDILTKRGQDINDFPLLAKSIDDLSNLSFDNPQVSLKQLDEVRKKIIARQKRVKPAANSAKADPAQFDNLGIVKGVLDAYTDALFNSSMIKGTPEALSLWKQARAANADYRKRFKEDKVIRQLAEQEATPEMMRKWLVGANAVTKSEAALVVNRLKNLIGEDSPEFVSLRQDIALDIVSPLLLDEPNFKAFSNKLRDWKRNNNSLLQEVFLPDQISSFETLSKLAQSIKKTARQEDAGLDLSILDRVLAVTVFGHGIAKAQLKVKLAQKGIGLLRSVEGDRNRRQVMANILGYDIGKPLLGGANIGIPALGEALPNVEEITTPSAL